ncbi:hypothetical protein [Natronolimnobius baerhuensis]|uniref:Uncharacterized protein n=1 Tax=Natronolimnobius baerhuensis TaxID=253108 RepID=A0A202E4P5_9EURY|nr:hypothetical protein [Natronolimnobius baerhuensis]OVE83174.1 hypothetical protein B2G88_17345 [Natronolimnobius baerhuensis]
MNNENTPGNEVLPTEGSTAGRPHGRDDTPADSSTHEKPPRSNATDWTEGCTGLRPRPVESDDGDAESPSGDDAEILEHSTGGDPRAESQLLEQIRVANEFDAAKRLEPTPATLETERVWGYRLRVEGDNRSEWIRTTYAVKLEECR